MKRRRSMLSSILIIVATVVAVVVLVARFGARSLVYHPTAIPEEIVRAFASEPGWQLIRHEVAPAVRLVGLVRPPAAPDASWVLFFGGNASDIGGNQSILQAVADDTDLGLAVFAYRGYDGSDGAPSERALFDDAQAVAGALKTRFEVPPTRLVVMGQSLGSGVATELAARLSDEGTPPQGLVLISPYRSIAALIDENVPLIPVGWAVPDPFRSDRAAPRVKAPTLIVHGDADRLIPPAHGRTMATLLPQAFALIVEDRGHNDLFDSAETVAAIRRFLLDPALP